MSIGFKQELLRFTYGSKEPDRSPSESAIKQCNWSGKYTRCDKCRIEELGSISILLKRGIGDRNTCLSGDLLGKGGMFGSDRIGSQFNIIVDGSDESQHSSNFGSTNNVIWHCWIEVSYLDPAMPVYK